MQELSIAQTQMVGGGCICPFTALVLFFASASSATAAYTADTLILQVVSLGLLGLSVYYGMNYWYGSQAAPTL